MKHTFVFVFGLLAAIFAPSTSVFQDAKAVTTELVVLDPNTGLAIYGYDPVAYFVNQQPIKGIPEHEVLWKDAHWQFVSSANADRFQDAPDFYTPQFNGYGAMAMANARTTEGNPLIWAIFENKLYFFHTVNARSRWVRNVVANVEAATVNWERVVPKLAH